uniref:Pre-mRNA-splicing factor SPF27 n=1 Tax=Bionectria ochroleuca TaxID=29856 RepID=A0A8H7N369_BIOOC
MSLPPAFHESLPYIDPEPSPESIAAARSLIAAELSTFQPSPLPQTAEPSFSPAIQTELARETPAPDAPTDRLREVLENARVSDAYLASRRQNLELLDAYGKNAWLVGNHQLEAGLRRLEGDLADAKREIDIVNIERQRRQEDVKGEMHTLEETWRKGVGRVLETEVAVEELKEQIRNEMRNRS